MCKRFTQTFSVQANKTAFEKVFHISKSVLESSDVMAFLRYSVLEDNVLLRCWVMYVTWRLHVGLSRHRPPDTGGL